MRVADREHSSARGPRLTSQNRKQNRASRAGQVRHNGTGSMQAGGSNVWRESSGRCAQGRKDVGRRQQGEMTQAAVAVSGGAVGFGVFGAAGASIRHATATHGRDRRHGLAAGNMRRCKEQVKQKEDELHK